MNDHAAMCARPRRDGVVRPARFPSRRQGDCARTVRQGTVDANGNHIEDRGVSPTPGLFYVGRSWQISRASALLCGVGADAARIVDHVMSWLRREVDPGHRGVWRPDLRPARQRT